MCDQDKGAEFVLVEAVGGFPAKPSFFFFFFLFIVLFRCLLCAIKQSVRANLSRWSVLLYLSSVLKSQFSRLISRSAERQLMCFG